MLMLHSRKVEAWSSHKGMLCHIAALCHALPGNRLASKGLRGSVMLSSPVFVFSPAPAHPAVAMLQTGGHLPL